MSEDNDGLHETLIPRDTTLGPYLAHSATIIMVAQVFVCVTFYGTSSILGEYCTEKLNVCDNSFVFVTLQLLQEWVVDNPLHCVTMILIDGVDELYSGNFRCLLFWVLQFWHCNHWWYTV